MKSRPLLLNFCPCAFFEKIFSKSILKITGKKDEKIAEAVQRYGYRQREAANNLEMHVTSVIRILRESSKC